MPRFRLLKRIVNSAYYGIKNTEDKETYDLIHLILPSGEKICIDSVKKGEFRISSLNGNMKLKKTYTNTYQIVLEPVKIG